ncbi:hypothetical protein WOLCODRAFT_95695 [Wolfiporia cocos MD-104 SS10]|uniref:CSN8/PSMD8/EIF3K domain-containing protein n=1 Tax=Wolfiporia cocos (strain MD-104) TaxID=742152 RepID=A0A2H3JM40_WOLCO|nr:hypothetical protein WOLCODRAFT_95695 [Wolfiporia cocos MD-104 SS10]
MTGPPTPPPSTAAEIADQSRMPPPPADAGIAPPTQTASQSQPTAPAPVIPAANKTPYENVFPQIASLAMNRDYQKLIEVAEHEDLVTGIESNDTRLYIIAPLVLSYLIIDELAAAQHALLRLPEPLSSYPIYNDLFRLLAAASNRKHGQVYARARALYEHCQSLQGQSAEFVAVVLPMINAFTDAFRNKTFATLSKAYTSISLSLVQKYIGLPVDQILSVATNNGWSYNADTQILTTPVRGSSRYSGIELAPSVLDTFASVAGSIRIA